MSMYIYAMPTHLKNCDTPFVVRSYCDKTVSYNKFVDKMAEGRTGQTKSDLVGCLQLFFEDLSKELAEGNQVELPIGTLYMSASGKLETRTQPFVPNDEKFKHVFCLHIRTDKENEENIIKKMEWNRVEFFDKTSGIIDSIEIAGKEDHAALSGDTMIIHGSRLKFDEKDPECGVFMHNADSNIRCQVYPEILPSKLIAIFPRDIPAGTYTLSIHTRPNGKDLRGCIREEPIAIERAK